MMSRALFHAISVIRRRLRRGRTAWRRRRLAVASVCCLYCLLAGLAGCATFDSKYERVEIPGPEPESKPEKTSTEGKSTAEKQAAAIGAYQKSRRADVVKQTSFKPVVVTAAGLRAQASAKPIIQKIAFFQNDLDTKDKEKKAKDSTDKVDETKVDKVEVDQGKATKDAKDKPGITVPDIGEADPKSKKPANSAESLPGDPGTKLDDRGVEIESPDGALGITLDQSINLCLVNDPVIRAGLESINMASGDALTASLKPNPLLFNDIQLLPLTRPFTPTKQGGPPQYDAILTYPIDWFVFGKRAAAMQSSNLAVRVSQSEYEDLVRVRVLEAATAFFGVLEARALREVARQDAENFRQIEGRTSLSVDNGGRPLVELNRVRLDRLKSEQFLRDAENALIAATAQLRVLLGRDDGDPAFDVVGTLESPNLIEPLPLDEAVGVADQNRPDLEAARWRIAQADAVIELERRKAYPTLIPGFGYTKQFQTKAIGFPDADSWMAQLTMSIPLFDRNQGNQVKASALAAQAGFQLQARRVALRGEVVRATQDLNTAAANARAVAQEQLQIAKQVRDSINAAYEAGGRPLIDALDAQRNYRETYRLFITSRANYARAAVKYSATLGRQMTP